MHSFVVINAFVTDSAFSGNPAGVLILNAYPEDSWMQGVADELHQAETAFVVPDTTGRFALRWFTPTAEVELCGHATLAAAAHLWQSRLLLPDRAAEFDTRSGPLTARLGDGEITLDFPAVPATEIEQPPALHTALPGAAIVWTGITGQADPRERNILAVLRDEVAIVELAPDLRAVEQLPAGGLIVSARANDDVVSRYFAPSFGIPEDPVTGSAHCTIGPYWREDLGPEIWARQLSARGGRLHVTTTPTGRVLLRGRARPSMRGTIEA